MVAHLFIPAYAGVISSLEKYITPDASVAPFALAIGAACTATPPLSSNTEV